MGKLTWAQWFSQSQDVLVCLLGVISGGYSDFLAIFYFQSCFEFPCSDLEALSLLVMVLRQTLTSVVTKHTWKPEVLKESVKPT